MLGYVVAYAFSVDTPKPIIPLILKNKPEYLQGMLNLPGGKIEPDEDPVSAAIRELKEETGLDEIQEYDPMVYYPSELLGIIHAEKFDIYCVSVPVSSKQELKPRAYETETVSLHDVTKIYNLPNLMPNLRVVIPLMQANIKEWELYDIHSDWRGKEHRVELVISPEKTEGFMPMNIMVPGVAAYKNEEEE